MSPLVPCPSCARHVRASEEACPFCATAIGGDLASRVVPPARQRLERLAAFTFAATVAATACGGQTDAERGSAFDGGGASSSGDNGGGQPVYGMPAPDPTGTAAPAYGMPAPPVDAGAKDAGDGGDGG